MSEDVLEIRRKHQELAGVVKGVHAQLRNNFRKSDGDYEKVWNEHCRDTAVLSEYADAMHHLATDIWTKHPETRIDWCRKTCQEYFLRGGLLKVVEKEKRKRKYAQEKRAEGTNENPAKFELTNQSEDVVSSGEYSISKGTNGSQQSSAESSLERSVNATSDGFLDSSNYKSISRLDSHPADSQGGTSPENEFIFGPPEGVLEAEKQAVYAKYKPRLYNTILLPFEGKIRLLDVGSCFNPFLDFENFLAIGIDISPAVKSVFNCDFLHLDVTEPLQLAADSSDTYISSLKDPVEKLPAESFHVVVFSLLLEYFPSSFQRWICCQKANQLLMVNGLLIIITPDSKHQNRNAPMIRSWKQGIESLGFTRWRYVKLEHLHCMAFRKIVQREDRDEQLVKDTGPDMLYIPQDFSETEPEEKSDFFFGSITREEDDAFLRACFGELPGLDV